MRATTSRVTRALAFASMLLLASAASAQSPSEDGVRLRGMPAKVETDRASQPAAPPPAAPPVPYDPAATGPVGTTVVPRVLMKEQADFRLRDALRNVPGVGVSGR